MVEVIILQPSTGPNALRLLAQQYSIQVIIRARNRSSSKNIASALASSDSTFAAQVASAVSTSTGATAQVAVEEVVDTEADDEEEEVKKESNDLHPSVVVFLVLGGVAVIASVMACVLFARRRFGREVEHGSGLAVDPEMAVGNLSNSDSEGDHARVEMIRMDTNQPSPSAQPLQAGVSATASSPTAPPSIAEATGDAPEQPPMMRARSDEPLMLPGVKEKYRKQSHAGR